MDIISKRFKQLMESKLGNVKPLLKENIDFPRLRDAVLQCLKSNQIELPNSCVNFENSPGQPGEIQACLTSLKDIAKKSSLGNEKTPDGHGMGLVTNDFRFCVKKKTNVDLINIEASDFQNI